MNSSDITDNNITMVTIILPGRPYTKKNNPQIVRAKNGKTYLFPSPNYQKYEASANDYIPDDKRQSLDVPVQVKVLYYMPNACRVDLTNLLSATDDLLVHYNVIKDDNCKIISSHDGSRVFVDKDNPRAEIYIQHYEG